MEDLAELTDTVASLESELESIHGDLSRVEDTLESVKSDLGRIETDNPQATESRIAVLECFVTYHPNLEPAAGPGYAYYNLTDDLVENTNIGGDRSDAAGVLKSLGYEVSVKSIEVASNQHDLLVELSISELSN